MITKDEARTMALSWLKRSSPYRRTSEEVQAYLNGLQDAGLPDRICEAVEDAMIAARTEDKK